MAISIDLTTTPSRIFIPQADLTVVSLPDSLYSIDMEAFHNELRTLETDVLYTIEPITHNHTRQQTLGAVTYPRRIEILPDYEVEFEDAQYRVRLLGGDSNVEDVQVLNQVSVSTFNSAGNSVTELALAQALQLLEIYTRLGLNLADPITDTPAGIDSDSGDIDIDRSGDGETTSTLTRQP